MLLPSHRYYRQKRFSEHARQAASNSSDLPPTLTVRAQRSRPPNMFGEAGGTHDHCRLLCLGLTDSVLVDDGWPARRSVNTIDPQMGWNVAMHCAAQRQTEMLREVIR